MDWPLLMMRLKGIPAFHVQEIQNRHRVKWSRGDQTARSGASPLSLLPGRLWLVARKCPYAHYSLTTHNLRVSLRRSWPSPSIKKLKLDLRVSAPSNESRISGV